MAANPKEGGQMTNTLKGLQPRVCFRRSVANDQLRPFGRCDHEALVFMTATENRPDDNFGQLRDGFLFS